MGDGPEEKKFRGFPSRKVPENNHNTVFVRGPCRRRRRNEQRLLETTDRGSSKEVREGGWELRPVEDLAQPRLPQIRDRKRK